MTLSMKKHTTILFLFCITCIYSQGSKQPTFKKRVLESTEIDFLASYYQQDGSKSAVGGLGASINGGMRLTVNIVNVDLLEINNSDKLLINSTDKFIL